jgi:hypothetical protein
MVIKAEVGSTRIVITLYGVITPERVAAEQKIANHRAQQLGHQGAKGQNMKICDCGYHNHAGSLRCGICGKVLVELSTRVPKN